MRGFALAAGLLALAGASAPVPAFAQAPYVDRRVTSIPAATLLSADPSTLVDPRRQQAARDLEAGRRVVYFIWLFSQIVALGVLWSSGYAARLRDALSARIKNNVVLRFVFGFAVATVAALAALPANLIGYRNAFAYDITGEHVGGWLHDIGISWILTSLAAGIVSAYIYTLVARTRLWYAYAVLGLLAIVMLVGLVQPVAIAPLYDRQAPISPIARGAPDVRAVETLANLPAVPVVVAQRSRRLHIAGGNTAGFGPTERVVLTDTLLDVGTVAEIRFVTARQLAHIIYRDDLKLALAQTLTIVVTIALSVFVADRIGFRRDDDPLARLPLVGAMLGLVSLLTVPAYNGYARGIEDRADRYALALTNDKIGAVRYYVRLADETLTPLCGSQTWGWYFSARPSLSERISTAVGREDSCH